MQDIQKNHPLDPIHMLGVLKESIKLGNQFVLLRSKKNTFVPLIESPKWLDCLNLKELKNSNELVLQDDESFLANFLFDAESLWAKNTQLKIDSDYWIEENDNDESLMRASAINIVIQEQTTHKILLIEQVEEKRGVFSKSYQLKRNTILDNEHLQTLTQSLAALNSEKSLRIKEKELSQKKLEQLHASLMQKNMELENFTRVVAHNLRGPASTILMYCELILKFNFKEAQKELLENVNNIHSVSKEMLNLISALLNYATLEEHELELTTLNTEDLISEICIELANDIKNSDAKIEVKKLPKVRGCEFMLKQLFSNLIANALKFRRKDTKPLVTIKTSNQVEDGFSCIDISDNGVGIKEENRERIFNIFEQASKEFGGFGIGLSVCRKIVDSHGGQLRLNSNESSGTTFSVLLPH